MRYTGIQPHYFPRLHYFARIIATDVFMIRDEVQYVKKHKFPDGKTDKSHQSDTLIKQSAGILDLSVPIAHHGLQSIKDVTISYQTRWQENHLNTLKFTYGAAPHFDELFPSLTELLSFNFTNLAALNIATIVWALFILLGKKAPQISDLTIQNINKLLVSYKQIRLKSIRLSSELVVKYSDFSSFTPNAKILTLIKEVGANEDYCGGTAKLAYMDDALFKKAGIKIVVQNWKCQQYLQQFPKNGFIPNLSIIDLLMNIQAREALSLLS